MASTKPAKALENWLLGAGKNLNRLPKPLLSTFDAGLRFGPYLILFLSVWFAIQSYWSILPGIFQDEYVYSMGARKTPLAEQDYPNYLFSLLFQTTNSCGVEFYQCGKALNSILLVVFLALVFQISRTVHSRNISLLLTAAAAVSPVTVFASFFMPEMLFYTLNLLAIYLLLMAFRKKSALLWFALSLVLGLALLTKRHELFLLPGFALAILIILLQNKATIFGALFRAVAFGLLIPVLLRQLGVLLIVGDFFAPLLGSTYASSFRESLGGSSGDSDGAAPSIFELLSQGTWHLVFHLAVLAIFGLFALRVSRPVVEQQRSSVELSNIARGRLSVVTLSLVGAIVPVVTFFESYLTLVGDDHSLRLLGRYYEFVLVLLLILAVGLVGGKVSPARRRIWIGATAGSYLVFVMLIGPFIQTGPSDSMTIHGLKTLGPWILVFVAMFLIGSLLLKRSRAIGAGIISILIPLLIVSAGLATRSDVASTIGSRFSSVDLAGQFVAEALPEVRSERILVIGRSRVEVTAVKFSIDQPNVRHSLQPDKPRQLSARRLQNIEYIVTVAPAALVTSVDVELIHEGPGFTVYIVNRP